MVRERFGASVRAKLFRFLHLLREGMSMPITSTSTANKIKSDKDPRRAGAAGVVAAATGGLTGSSEAWLAVAAGLVVAAAAVAGGLR